jgi:hypothetical protein
MTTATVFPRVPAAIEQIAPPFVAIRDRPDPLTIRTAGCDHGFAVHCDDTFGVDASSHPAVGTERCIGHD